MLFKQIDILKKSGIAIVYITHRLDEVFEVADRVTILRDGMNEGTYDVKEGGIDKNRITELMLGKKISQIFPERTEEIGDEFLRLEDLTQKGYFTNSKSFCQKGRNRRNIRAGWLRI